MSAEAVEQEDVAIERGISTYLQNCVVCHGPAGEGYSEPGAEGTGRIGMPLGGDTELGRKAQELNQSDDPVVRQERYNLITKTIHNGRGLMPAWGRGAEGGALLTDEQIHELATDDPERRLGSRLQRRDPGLRRLPDLPARRRLPPVGRRRPRRLRATPQGRWRQRRQCGHLRPVYGRSARHLLHPDGDRGSLRHRGDDPAAEPGSGPAQLQHRRAQHQRRHRPGRNQGSQDQRAGGRVRVLLQRPRSQGGGDGRHADLAADGVRRPAGNRGRERRRGRGPGHRRKRPARRQTPQLPRT